MTVEPDVISKNGIKCLYDKLMSICFDSRAKHYWPNPFLMF